MPGPATYALHVAGGLVRELWPDQALIEEMIKAEPILGICKKDTNWSYAIIHHPLGWGGTQGIGRNYADAKRLKSAAKEQEFQVTTREMYATLSLEGKLLRASEYGKKSALLVDPLKREGEACLRNMRYRFSTAIHGNGVGVVGRIATTSTVNTATVVLSDPNDLKNFQQETAIQLEETGLPAGALRDGGAEARILSVGTWDNPTLTLSVAWNVAFPSVVAGDRIYYTGNYDNDYIYGLDAFLPNHTGTPGTFLTCNRNLNPGWLAGYVMNGGNMSGQQRIWAAARRSVDAGGEPDVYFMSTRNFEKLLFEFENKLVMQKVPAADVGKFKMGVSYQGVEIAGPAGPIMVMASAWMPDNVERCGEKDTLKMGSIGPLVHWDNGNGPDALRTEDGTDSRELRAVSDPGFLVEKPGAWVRVAA